MPIRSNRTGARRATSIVSSRARSRLTCRVQAPTKYELVINLRTAKALGLEFDLDPCSPGPGHWVPARKIYTEAQRFLLGAVSQNKPNAPALLLIGEEHRACHASACHRCAAGDVMRALVEQVLRQLVGSLPRAMEN
jgi:hypothetical protein